MQRLLQMPHAQWAYRNATVHLEVKDGQTATAHEIILKTMEGFLHTVPEQLLEEHCHLLFSDFAALASGPTKDKLEWISEIDSAMGAAEDPQVQAMDRPLLPGSHATPTPLKCSPRASTLP
jgi:hypothetical protein